MKVIKLPRFFKVIPVSLVLIFLSVQVLAQGTWKFHSEKEGIKVYTSEVAGSKIKALKVECNFQATLPHLVAVLMDVKNATEWVYKTKSVTLLKQVSPSELYYHSEVSMPWPIANRDFVAHLTVTQNPETKVVTIDGPVVPGYVAKKKDVIRIEKSTGKWLLIPINDHETKIEYTLQVDPGGDIPAWLVNLFASEGPVQSFKGLKLQLQKPEHKNAAFSFIRN